MKWSMIIPSTHSSPLFLHIIRSRTENISQQSTWGQPTPAPLGLPSWHHMYTEGLASPGTALAGSCGTCANEESSRYCPTSLAPPRGHSPDWYQTFEVPTLASVNKERKACVQWLVVMMVECCHLVGSYLQQIVSPHTPTLPNISTRRVWPQAGAPPTLVTSPVTSTGSRDTILLSHWPAPAPALSWLADCPHHQLTAQHYIFYISCVGFFTPQELRWLAASLWRQKFNREL